MDDDQTEPEEVVPQEEQDRQRRAFAFFQDHFRDDKPFTKEEVRDYAGWSQGSMPAYWSKQFEPFVAPLQPRAKGSPQQFRVTDVFRLVGTWPKFRRHVSQKRKLTYEYEPKTYDTVLFFEFFLPLTNETVLRNALDALFYRETIEKKLRQIGFSELKKHWPAVPDESDAEYIERLIGWCGKRFTGYSIGHVSGRFRAGDILTIQKAAALQERGDRYLIDETTAVTRFIFPCEDSEQAERIKWFFRQLFVESVTLVAGEAEIWMTESAGGTSRLHVWYGKEG